jgi:hypothetical protein
MIQLKNSTIDIKQQSFTHFMHIPFDCNIEINE